MTDKFNDVEHLRIIIFCLIHQYWAFNEGLEHGMPMEEINKMTYSAMVEMIKSDLIDTNSAKKSYYRGKALYEGEQV